MQDLALNKPHYLIVDASPPLPPNLCLVQGQQPPLDHFPPSLILSVSPPPRARPHIYIKAAPQCTTEAVMEAAIYDPHRACDCVWTCCGGAALQNRMDPVLMWGLDGAETFSEESSAGDGKMKGLLSEKDLNGNFSCPN